VHRLDAAGYTTRVLRRPRWTTTLRADLEEIARTWRGDQPERGFVMALDALFRLDDALFVVGFDARAGASGFLHFAVCRAASALSLSTMPRLDECRTASTSG